MTSQFNASMPENMREFVEDRAIQIAQRTGKWCKPNRSGVVQEAIQWLQDCIEQFGEDYREALKVQPEPAYIRRLEQRILERLDNLKLVPVEQAEEVAGEGYKIGKDMIG